MTLTSHNLQGLLLAASLLLAWTHPARAGDHYAVDLSDAEVGFTVDVLGLFRVSGRFDEVDGGLLFSGACAAQAIAFSVQTASVNTRNRLRDSIIRGAGLLNSREHPVIAFHSTRIVNRNGHPGEITGMLQINGRSRQVSFQVESPTWPAVAGDYHATASISRADFGIPSPMIGTSDRVELRVSLRLREEAFVLASTSRQETLQ